MDKEEVNGADSQLVGPVELLLYWFPVKASLELHWSQ